MNNEAGAVVQSIKLSLLDIQYFSYTRLHNIRGSLNQSLNQSLNHIRKSFPVTTSSHWSPRLPSRVELSHWGFGAVDFQSPSSQVATLFFSTVTLSLRYVGDVNGCSSAIKTSQTYVRSGDIIPSVLRVGGVVCHQKRVHTNTFLFKTRKRSYRWQTHAMPMQESRSLSINIESSICNT